MRFFYGEKMPLRILDEAEFWKQQESEHTVVIRQLVAGLEQNYVEELERWEQAFNQTEGIAVRYIEAIIRAGNMIPPQLYPEVIHFIQFCLRQSQNFVMFLNQMIANSELIQDNPVYVTVINHIIRESEYFIGITQTFLTLC